MRIPTPDSLIDSAVNGFDLYLGHGLADLRPQPSSIIDEGPQRTVHRYRGGRRTRADRSPVLLIPPLAAPASCFDLRRGCSVAEHLTGLGYPTYLVDYGPIGFSDRQLGLEHWVGEVIPRAVEVVSEDSGGRPVQTIGWCLGGIMTLLAAAARTDLPIASVVGVASPFDFEQVRMAGPIRQLSKLTGGALATGLYRALGGAPASLVSLGFQLTAYDRYLKKPLWLLQHLDDRETLAHSEATDRYMAHMFAYPGRTFGQLYHDFFRVNSLSRGKVELEKGRTIDLADVTQPVLMVGGTSDVLAPIPAVFHVGGLLPNAAEVTLETAPGGHLGVLTGRSARNHTWSYIDSFLGRHEPVTRGEHAPASTA